MINAYKIIHIHRCLVLVLLLSGYDRHWIYIYKIPNAVLNRIIMIFGSNIIAWNII